MRPDVNNVVTQTGRRVEVCAQEASTSLAAMSAAEEQQADANQSFS